MKRTLTGIAAASMVLGTMVPAAFAKTTAAKTPADSYNKATISLDGSTLFNGAVNGIVHNGTQYLPLAAAQQIFTQAGYTNTWNGVNKVWAISTNGATVGTIKSVPGTVAVMINDKVATHLTTIVAHPGNNKKIQATTYVPVAALQQIFTALGYGDKWNGTAKPTPKLTLTSPVTVYSLTPTDATDATVIFSDGSSANVSLDQVLTPNTPQDVTFTYNGKQYAVSGAIWDVSPSATVTGITDGSTVNTATANITVAGDDPTNETYAVSVNGQAVTANADGSYTLNFQEGANTVTVSVTDYGVTTSTDYHVTYDQSAAANSLQIATPTAVAVNGTETLSATVYDANNNVLSLPAGDVTWAVYGASNGGNVSDASITNGVFTASQAGTYTVTASVYGTPATAQATINVLGTPAAVQLSAASNTLIANSKATDVITAKVYDANGNFLSNYNGTVNVYLTSAGGGDYIGSSTSTNGSLATPVAYTAVNGVVTITLTAGDVANSTDTINVALPGGTWASTSVATVAQTASAIGFGSTAPTTIDTSVNYYGSGHSLSIPVSLLDQDGQPILSGNPVASVTVSGPAVLASSPSLTSGAGLQSGTFNVSSGVATLALQGLSNSSTGTVTVTVSAPGLTSKTLTLNAFVGGKYASLGLASQPTTTSFTADKVGAATALVSAFQTYNVIGKDANGNVTQNSIPSSVNVTVTGPNGSASSAIGVWNGTTYAASTSSTPVSVSASSNSFPVALGLVSGATTIPAGTYTVKIVDPNNSGNVLTETFTVTPGQVHTVALTPSSSTTPSVLLSNPTSTVTAQVKDAWGNNVNQSGIIVDFTRNPDENSSSVSDGVMPSLNGSASNASVATNASGQAMVNVSWANDTNLAAGYNDILDAVIDPQWATANNVTDVAGAQESGMFTFGNTIAATVTESTDKTSYSVGSTPEITAYALASNGTLQGDTLDYTVTGPTGFSSVSNTVVSGHTVTLSALNIPGTYTVSVTDPSVPTAPAATSTFTVNAGTASAVEVLDGSTILAKATGTGLATLTTPNSFTSNSTTPVALTIAATDANGNPVAAPSAITVNLGQTGGSGLFETSATGSAPVTSVTIPQGSTGVTIYYVDGTNGETVQPSISGAPTYTAVATTLTAGSTVSTASASAPYEFDVDATIKDQFAGGIAGLNAGNFTVLVNGVPYTFTASATPAAGQFTAVATGNGNYTIEVFTSSSAAGQSIVVGYPGLSSATVTTVSAP